MEDASKYIARPKLDSKLTEVYRVYYDKSGISFDLFLWIEEAALNNMIKKGHKLFKAYPLEGFEWPITICKN